MDAAAALVVAKTAEAGTKAKAIGTEAAQVAPEDDRGLGGSAVDPTEVAEAYTLGIKRDRTGTTVEIAGPRECG